jgi:hypothetical protein
MKPLDLTDNSWLRIGVLPSDRSEQAARTVRASMGVGPWP